MSAWLTLSVIALIGIVARVLVVRLSSRAIARALKAFNNALDSGQFSIYVDEQARQSDGTIMRTLHGRYGSASFIFSVDSHHDGSRDYLYRHNFGQPSERRICGRVASPDDISDPLARAWIKLRRQAVSACLHAESKT